MLQLVKGLSVCRSALNMHNTILLTGLQWKFGDFLEMTLYSCKQHPAEVDIHINVRV